LPQHHRFSVAIVLVLSISAFYDVAPANAVARISSAPTTLTLPEGSSAITTIALDEPIVCPGLPCQVSLTFRSSDPSLVTFSPSTLTWLSTDWSQTRTLTVSALADQKYRGNQSISVSATAVSTSAYYSGFVLNIPVSTIESDRSPAEIAAKAQADADAAAAAAKAQQDHDTALALGTLALAIGTVESGLSTLTLAATKGVHPQTAPSKKKAKKVKKIKPRN